MMLVLSIEWGAVEERRGNADGAGGMGHLRIERTMTHSRRIVTPWEREAQRSRGW